MVKCDNFAGSIICPRFEELCERKTSTTTASRRSTATTTISATTKATTTSNTSGGGVSGTGDDDNDYDHGLRPLVPIAESVPLTRSQAGKVQAVVIVIVTTLILLAIA